MHKRGAGKCTERAVARAMNQRHQKGISVVMYSRECKLVMKRRRARMMGRRDGLDDVDSAAELDMEFGRGGGGGRGNGSDGWSRSGGSL